MMEKNTLTLTSHTVMAVLKNVKLKKKLNSSAKAEYNLYINNYLLIYKFIEIEHPNFFENNRLPYLSIYLKPTQLNQFLYNN